MIRFLSTPSARRATLPSARTAQLLANFYPRPPRGGRRWQHKRAREQRDFYPRPPRGGRPRCLRPLRWARQFLSTPSARRATLEEHDTTVIQQISIHALREEGDTSADGKLSLIKRISIHALREEGDDEAGHSSASGIISIHALREEGDLSGQVADGGLGNFYPRPPRGGRPTTARATRRIFYFYPRPPRGGRRPP